jgi:phenylacetate-CoA ligase
LSFVESIVRHIGYPLWLAYKGELGIVAWHKRFEPLWGADPGKLQELRQPALVAMLVHAASTTKYYSELFRKIGFDPRGPKSIQDIRSLPFLNKEQLNQDIDSFLSNLYRRNQLIRSSTGGSSGVSLTFYRDRRVQAIRRAQDRTFNAKLGIYPGMRRAWVWGSPLDIVSLRSLKARTTNFLTERAIHFYSFDATTSKMDDFLKELVRHRPKAVFAYPNMLAALARRVQETGVPAPQIPKVVVTAEPLYEWQRVLFKEVFGSETFERYGSREIGTVASECCQHGGMHIFEPTYCLEVIDERGNAVPNGQMGELVVTDLFNRAMPLIRYRTGDMVTIDDRPCRCGCSWRRIVAIGGRVVDMIIRPDGTTVEGLVIINALHTSGMRAKVQVVQTSPTSLTVKYLDTSLIPEEMRSGFHKRISELLQADINVAFEPVSQLRHDQSGKYRYVICECNRADS